MESDTVLSCLQSYFQFTLMILANFSRPTFVVLYADDILLLAPSVTAVLKLLRACAVCLLMLKSCAIY